MEVVLRNHTRDEATLLLTTRDGVGGSQSEGLAAPCDGTAAGGPIDPQWEIRVDGAQLMGHADPRPDVMDGEVLQIVIDVDAEGAAVALDVVPADQSVFAENGEALRTLIDAGGRCGS